MLNLSFVVAGVPVRMVYIGQVLGAKSGFVGMVYIGQVLGAKSEFCCSRRSCWNGLYRPSVGC